MDDNQMNPEKTEFQILEEKKSKSTLIYKAFELGIGVLKTFGGLSVMTTAYFTNEALSNGMFDAYPDYYKTIAYVAMATATIIGAVIMKSGIDQSIDVYLGPEEDRKHNTENEKER